MFIETQEDIVLNSFKTFISLSKEDIITNPFRALNLMEASWGILQSEHKIVPQFLKHTILSNKDICDKYKQTASYTLNLVNKMKNELKELING